MSRATLSQPRRARPGRATRRFAAGPGTGLAAAGLALLMVGALGPFSDVGATLETSLAALILVVGLDQRPALLGTTLLVGELPARRLARLVWVTALLYGLVLGVDWTLEQRFDTFSLGAIGLSLAVVAVALRTGWARSDRRS